MGLHINNAVRLRLTTSWHRAIRGKVVEFGRNHRAGDSPEAHRNSVTHLRILL